MAEHILKTWSNSFDAIASGRKCFEWRKDDRGFEVGDVLVLKRFDPKHLYGSYVDYTDESPRNTLRVVVTYILRGMFGVPEGYCVMSIAPLAGSASEAERP